MSKVKVECDKKGVFGRVGGKVSELKIGSNEVDEDSAKSLIKRKLVTAVAPAEKATTKADEKKETTK